MSLPSEAFGGEGYRKFAGNASDPRWKVTGHRSLEIQNGSGTSYIQLNLAPDFRSWTGNGTGAASKELRSGKRLF